MSMRGFVHDISPYAPDETRCGKRLTFAMIADGAMLVSCPECYQHQLNSIADDLPEPPPEQLSLFA